MSNALPYLVLRCHRVIVGVSSLPANRNPSSGSPLVVKVLFLRCVRTRIPSRVGLLGIILGNLAMSRWRMLFAEHQASFQWAMQ